MQLWKWWEAWRCLIDQIATLRPRHPFHNLAKLSLKYGNNERFPSKVNEASSKQCNKKKLTEIKTRGIISTTSNVMIVAWPSFPIIPPLTSTASYRRSTSKRLLLIQPPENNSYRWQEGRTLPKRASENLVINKPFPSFLKKTGSYFLFYLPRSIRECRRLLTYRSEILEHWRYILIPCDIKGRWSKRIVFIFFRSLLHPYLRVF